MSVWDRERRTLSDFMEFDHVIRVNADGTVEDGFTGIYAPDVYHDEDNDVEVQGEGWAMLTGFTGQYGYRGAVMHPSEYIGGGLERHILTNPGYYVAVTVECYPEDGDEDPEPAGWGIAYRPS